MDARTRNHRDRPRKSVTSVSLVETLLTTVSDSHPSNKNQITSKQNISHKFSLTSLEITLHLLRKLAIPSDDLTGEGWQLATMPSSSSAVNQPKRQRPKHKPYILSTLFPNLTLISPKFFSNGRIRAQ